MSVVLFHCPKCGSYSTNAMASMVVSATLRPVHGDLWVHDISYPKDGILLEALAESRCEECDSPTELVTLDECPHRWKSMIVNTLPARCCTFCDERQWGRAVFDE